MSCHGWGVGDTCRVKAKLRQALQINHHVTINEGDEGEIRQIVDLVPHAHVVTIYWPRLQLETVLPDKLLADVENLSALARSMWQQQPPPSVDG